MKKLFLAGVLAASMAASSVASAAVTYGNADDALGIAYADNAVSVTEDLSTYSGDQMTVLVLDGDGSVVSESTILYIDQDTAPAVWEGNEIFQDMGLYLGSNENLPEGSYTVKVGGDNISELLVGTFTVAADPVVPSTVDVKFVFGDVNGGAYVGEAETDMSYVDASDALAVIKASVGGEKAKGGIANIGAVVTAVFPVEE